MKNFTLLCFLFLFSANVFFAQKPRPVKKPANANLVKTNVGSQREEFDKAVALANAADRIGALQKFLADFPFSTERTAALELIAGARAQLADEKLAAGDAAGGIELFKLAIKDAPTPASDKFFTDIILQIPTNLFFRGQRDAAVESAAIIEKKVEGNAKQLLGLATFYLGVENADEAKRLAGKAAAIEPNLPAVYQTLGLANRLNFDLDEAAGAYSKALELDANSVISKRSLAEMKRATGKSDEAIALYREILAANAADAIAQNGLVLALFDSGKTAEAEDGLRESLAQNPNNLFLMVGAAYWYAAHDNGAKAIELAQKAVAVEPRYVWSYLALARGFLLENRYYDAERTLLAARSYGNFPTLDYELASVRVAGGFYREAAQTLEKNFTVKDDLVATKLGGRVEKQAKSFTDALSLERRASIFEPLAADNPESAQRLKSLLDFHQKLESSAATDADIADAADKFVNGYDKMKLHRRLYVAESLLDKNKGLAKAAEMLKAAVGEVDSALDIPNPSSAVLADELYESRALAIAKNTLVIVPEVPRQTLSNILRGRIEELSGWALLEMDKPAEAVVRLRRAVGILPEKSAWQHSSQWRLGSALQADGKSPEALDTYIKSYTSDAPNAARRIIIEVLYRQINGSLEGLDAKIGASPISENAVLISALPKKSKTGKPAAAAQAPEKQAPVIAPVPKTETTENSGVQIKSPEQKNSLFDPIVITVPKTGNQATETKETPDNGGSSGIVRSRVVVVNKIPPPEIAKCEIVVSQPSISLLNNGGNLGVLVGFEDDAGDTKEITASSSSPNDVEVVLEPQIGAHSSRAFFIVKSVSGKTGIFTVTFDAPCGKKEMQVKVR